MSNNNDDEMVDLSNYAVSEAEAKGERVLHKEGDYGVCKILEVDARAPHEKAKERDPNLVARLLITFDCEGADTPVRLRFNFKPPIHPRASLHGLMKAAFGGVKGMEGKNPMQLEGKKVQMNMFHETGDQGPYEAPRFLPAS